MIGTLRWRHILIVASLAVLSLLAWIYAMATIRAMAREADATIPRVVRVIEAIERISDAAVALDAMARELAHAHEADDALEIGQADALFRDSLHKAKLDIPRPFTRDEALHARRLLEQHERYIDDLRHLESVSMARQARIDYYNERLRPLFTLITADADYLKNLARQRMDLFLDESREMSRQSTRRLLVILFLAAAATGFSIYFFDRSVLRPVRRIRKLALEIRDGNLDAWTDIPPAPTSRDEIGQLAEAINAMVQARSQAEKELARTAGALSASSALNRAIIDSTSDGVAALDPDFRIILHNEAFSRQFFALFGVTPAIGDRLLDLLDPFPRERATAAALWGRTLGGEASHVTEAISGKNPEPRYLDLRFDALRDSQGHITGALHIARDVTEQKRMERELRQSATELDRRVRERTAELTGLMESIPAIVWISRDPQCRTIAGNRTAHEFLGMAQGKNLSLTPGDAPAPKHFQVYAQGLPVPGSELPMQRAGRDGVPIRGVELEMRFDNGQRRFLFGNASPLRDEAGVVTGVIGAFVDITDRKNLERDLHRAKDAAERASRAKSRFLADVSHEIRTPMNAVIGMAEVLLRSSLPPEQGECARTIRQAAGHLLDLLNDILDLSKIEADKLVPQNAEFDLRDLLDSVVKTFSLNAREKGVSLDLRLAPDVPGRLFGDGRRLRQILINLVGNAVKFTERGRVTTSVDRRPVPEGGDSALVPLAFAVEDTGIGIAPAKLPHIFDDFTQAHDANAEKYGGTGLGLAISRHLARMLGGDITAVSREGRGSVFTATALFRPPASGETLPADIPGQIRQTADRPGGRRLTKILLVEDNPVNVKVAQLHLDKMGHDTTVAADGFAALKTLARESYDLVLMDLELPGMDGIEVARRIRAGEAGADRAATPIVAMTAHVLDEAREQCRAAGMDSYMAKPVNFFELEALIERLLAQAPHVATGKQPLFDKEQAKRRMGIDDQTLEPIFQAALEEFGDLLERLQHAADAGDAQALRIHAHTLKSVGATLGFSRGVALLADISTAAKNGDMEAVRKRTQELAHLFGQGLLEINAA
ncbi:PAS domain-containing protein [Desulfovibrio sulfodismutans]|uniref:Sensory/regulatory protein RpfC n=1 Tax=Desulfolutivibrio sulfodismutans TaxID=63561 RepID=A0A7K3NMZ3_9BACT|nr:ATP-binding protein [Desulfolutivibrio sulfodismutans]NDY57193.1 PAS domain-containing protein [Desulfolutivibrio sulfodismutans]QLA11815.1 PAS domain-containing protein [Desulfolutivibrio sulfodismutans DSM 3696]